MQCRQSGLIAGENPVPTPEQSVKRNERIYLTGFMGSGKSTIGPILANTIGYRFLDVDRAIEKATGKSVKQIFHDHGEAHFRALERNLIAELSEQRHLVVSLGGGTMVDPGNFHTITRSGIVVYLKATPEQIFKRLQRKVDRPTLTDVSGDRLGEEELKLRIEELFRQRELFYLRADVVVPTDETRVGITVDEVVRKLAPFLE